MDKFWEAAVGAAGLGAVGAFVFYALYRDWLKLGIFANLTKDQTYRLMWGFLILTFFFAIAALATYDRSHRPTAAWSDHAKFEVVVDGLPAALQTDEIPLSTPVTIQLSDLPASAKVLSWKEPAAGKILKNNGNSVRFSDDSEGTVNFVAVVIYSGSTVELSRSFNVKSPIKKE